MEILVNRSRFKLTEINYSRINDLTNNKSTLESYKCLSKGVILGPSSNTDSWQYKSFYHILEDVKKNPVPSNYRAFIIERSNINGITEEYTEEEIKIMSGIARALITEGQSKLTVYGKLELLEGLLRAIGHEKPLSNFYTFGKPLYNVYNEVYNSLNTTQLLKDEKVNVELSFPLYQGRKRYSIYQLVNDLIEDNSFILDTNNFALISPKASNKKVNTERVSNEWCRILGKTENKKRANLSIDFLANILAEIPENSIGIEPGKMHLTAPRKICIVKDGILINSEIIVKVNSKRLQQRLISSGVVKEKLLYKNELLLDLTKLPIINRDKLKVNIFDIAQTEVRYTFSSIACNYLDRLIYMRDRKLTSCPEKLPEPEKSEKEKYLENLGIYGNCLYSKRVKTESNASYRVIEVSGKIYDIPSYYSEDIYLYCNKLKCNHVIESFLKSIDNDAKTKSLAELKISWDNKYKKYEARLRDLKFRLLFGRTFNFRYIGKKTDYSKASNKIRVSIDNVSGLNVSVGWKFDNKTIYSYDIR